MVIPTGYRDSENAVVADIFRDHGRVSLSDLEPHLFAAILARHRH